ncbi:hypothetical protein Cgig2_004260 [Carnegiea gigantea]|uniref:glutathione gamma-glutamylcysteinyltransferase n=1 Tax=Carnegiea gigantea TaxID=171969 RepID=A0A9Q1QK30_9CARY|nr:hypothetical protein Cgig2_004260 [Carnegiea gigantea]
MRHIVARLFRSGLTIREKVSSKLFKQVPCHHLTTSVFPAVSSYSTTMEKVCCHPPTLASIPGRYRSSLPPPATSLYSTAGKRLFDDARAQGAAAGFLEIATNLTTQSKLTYCGLSSLTTILNALFIDPQHVWKGSWRWYDETMLASDDILKKADNDGLSFQDLVDLVPRDKVKLQATFASESSLPEFREHVLCSCSSDSSYILANFSRSMLGQTGKGHFSPIAAYNPTADAVLILDVARFKYPPHWVPCSNFWESMSAINPFTGKSRGY